MNHKQKFINKIEKLYPNFWKNYELISDYKNNKTHILLKSKFGVFKTTALKLYKSTNFTIASVQDKKEYVINKLLDLNKNIDLKIVNVNNSDSIVEDKYGRYRIKTYDLLKGIRPTIASAIDKNQVFINKVKEIHGDKYYFDEFLSYIKKDNPVTLNCVKHGRFSITANNLLQGQGCVHCGNIRKGWGINKLRNKIFKTAYVYLLHCFNEKENFYKIGITVKHPLHRIKAIPYNTDIINYKKVSYKEALHLEKNLHTYHSKYLYKPLIKFGGYTECYTQLCLTKLL